MKESIELNRTIFFLCVNAEIIGKEEQGGKREIQDAEKLQARLSHELSEAREKADKRKIDIKKQIMAKVPTLLAAATEFLDEIRLPKYTDEDQSIEVMLELIENNDRECNRLVHKMKDIREY